MHALSRQFSLFVQFPSNAPEAGKLLGEGTRSGNLEMEWKQGERARLLPRPRGANRPIGIPREHQRSSPAMSTARPNQSNGGGRWLGGKKQERQAL